MPRPDTITEADISRWSQNFAEYRKLNPDNMPAYLFDVLGTPEMLERTWFPGEWLSEQLTQLGCPAEERQAICFALGQRNAAARDPWVSATQALEDYREGIVNTNVPTLMVTKETIEYISDGNREP